MKHNVTAEWQGNLKFENQIDDHKFYTDAPITSGGENTGPGPKKLLLSALAGCTGMDVVSILKKMRVEPEKFNISVEADMTEEHPMYYQKMHVVYEFTGKDLPLAKIEKAVKLSKENYCGVEALFKKAIEITSEIKLVES